MTSGDAEIVLQARGLCKSFAGVAALEDVDLVLRAGEVHALMGQNGAGKSTLIKLLTGVMRPDSGEMWVSGQAVSPSSPAQAQHLGISTVYQEVNLCPNLSVAENIVGGRYPRRRWTGAIDWNAVNAHARDVLAGLGKRHGVSAATMAYAWILRHPSAPLPITGSGRIEGLREAVAALDLRMSTEDWYAVWQASAGREIA